MATVSLDAIHFFNPSSQHSLSSVKRTTPLYSNHRPTALPRRNEGGRAPQSRRETDSMAGIALDDDDFPPIAELVRHTLGPKLLKAERAEQSLEENPSSSSSFSKTIQSAIADGVGKSRETPIVLNDETDCDLDNANSSASNVTSASQGASLWTPPITLQDHRTRDEVSEYDGIEAKLYSALVVPCNTAPVHPANHEMDCDLDKASSSDSIATTASRDASPGTPPTTPGDHLTGDEASKYNGAEANLCCTLIRQRDTTPAHPTSPTTHHNSELPRDGDVEPEHDQEAEEKEDEQDGENSDDDNDDNESSRPAKQCTPLPSITNPIVSHGYKRRLQRSSRRLPTISSTQQHQEPAQEAEQEKDNSNSSSDNDSDENYMDNQSSDDSDGPRPPKRRQSSRSDSDSTPKSHCKVRALLPPDKRSAPVRARLDRPSSLRFNSLQQRQKIPSHCPSGDDELASSTGAEYQEWPIQSFLKCTRIGTNTTYDLEINLPRIPRRLNLSFPLDGSSLGYGMEALTEATIPHTAVAHSKTHARARATRPEIKRPPWTPEEDATVRKMKKDGCSWAEIHAALPGRSKGTIQVRYSTKLKGQS